MATSVTSTTQISYELSLENSSNPNDTARRTVSFDLPATADPDACSDAASLFAAAGMSNVFQPTSWRDSGGVEDVYILKAVTPVFIEKTVTEYDTTIVNP